MAFFLLLSFKTTENQDCKMALASANKKNSAAMTAAPYLMCDHVNYVFAHSTNCGVNNRRWIAI
jgi:hypothetical protein